MARAGVPVRVVLDTNIVLSALIFGGKLSALRDAWQTGLCVPLIGEETTRELMRALSYPKFRLDKFMQEELLADYLPYGEVVRILHTRPPAVPKCRDPFDVPFLELAYAGKAKVLVTGDEDLLALADKTPFKILRADAFLRIIATA